MTWDERKRIIGRTLGSSIGALTAETKRFVRNKSQAHLLGAVLRELTQHDRLAIKIHGPEDEGKLSAS